MILSLLMTNLKLVLLEIILIMLVNNSPLFKMLNLNLPLLLNILQKLTEIYEGCLIDVTITNNTDINFKTFWLDFVALDVKGYPFDDAYFKVSMRPNQRAFDQKYVEPGLASGNNCNAIRGVEFNRLLLEVYDKDNIPRALLIEDTIELDELRSYTREDFFEIVNKAIIFDNQSPITKIVKNILPRTF